MTMRSPHAARIPVLLRTTLGLILAWTSSSPAHAGGSAHMGAEEMFFSDFPVVFVASTRAESIFKTVSTVSVIDRQMIDNYNFQTVGEAVATVPGFDVIRTAFMNDIPTARGVLQDNYANKVLVMINNVPSWNPVTGEVAMLNRVDINDVERIEVLKGPASVLYGSNAYTGIVNLVLKERKMDGESFQFRGGIGSEKSFRAGGSYNASRGEASISLSANTYTEDGRKVFFTDGASPATPRVRGIIKDTEYPKGGNFTLSAKAGGHALLVNTYKDEFTALEGVDPVFSSGAGSPQPRDGWLANYTFKKSLLDDKLNLKYSASYDRNQRDFARSADPVGARTEVVGSRTFTSLIANMAMTENLDMELGADWDYRQSLHGGSGLSRVYNFRTDVRTAPLYYKKHHVYEYSGFGQLGLKAGDFKVTIGTRHTKNQFSGDNLSSRGTVVYSINDTNSLKLIAGQSYRAPSLFEIYIVNAARSVTGGIYEKIPLKPETAESVELAYLTSVNNKLFVQFLGYQAGYDDRIARQPRLAPYTFPDGFTTAGTNNYYTNTDDLMTRGVELEVNYRNPWIVNAFANATYISPMNKTSREINFRYVPDYTVVGGVSRGFGSFFASALLRHRAQTEARLKGLSPFTTADLAVGYKKEGGRVKHTLAVTNVGDTQVYFPQTVYRTYVLNEVPSQYRRRISYMFSADF
jgi:outer membrane receptor protein involved in Fe transport